MLQQGKISIYEAEKLISKNRPAPYTQILQKNMTAAELGEALDAANEKIMELEERQERIRRHLDVLLPFAKRALKGASIQAKYRFVLRPVPRNTLVDAADRGEELVRELQELKKHVADMESENLLLSVRNDDPQQMAVVHALCLIKSVFEVSTVQDALEIMKSLPLLSEDAVNEFFRMLTRTINFARAFMEQLTRISLTTPSHLDEAARKELQKHVDGRPPETAFEVPALRDCTTQQLVIYTRGTRSNSKNCIPGSDSGD